ncbi:Aste57867_14327 [Aphanomyces stellatus]|uniref:Aste57867_14327 protein n=1 Tax=Aphanomyces stellatus TaxID=120398 RepID=A0A485L223_9STRA|nr:hypothetical protein As57867_014273 [Aphanomyces stellatus]VFT91151.1 Aste57867_14327 [Aphanomyces stellatus]
MHRSNRTPRVRFNRRSVVLSSIFTLNLLVLPLEVYMYEVSPFERTGFRAPPLFPGAYGPQSNPDAFVPVFQALYNDSSQVYSYDRMNLLDVICTTLPRNQSLCDSSATILHTHVGAFYYPKDLQNHLAKLTCTAPSPNGVARSWHFRLFGHITSTSVVWLDDATSDPFGSTSTIHYLFIPLRQPMAWLVFKLAARLAMWNYIVYLIVHRYVRHVCHLGHLLETHQMHEGSSAVRFDIVVGEPTPVIVAHPLICLFFIADMWVSAEYFGLACLRVSQLSNLFCFFLGLLFCARMMWFAVAVLMTTNAILKRRRKHFQSSPVDTTTLTVLAAVLGTVAIHVQAVSPVVLEFYAFLFNAATVVNETGQVTGLECGYAMAVASVTLGCVPAALVFSTSLRPTKQAVGQRLRRMSTRLGISPRTVDVAGTTEQPRHYVESMFGFSDLKQRLTLWLCCGHRANIENICYGGSAYRLFHVDAAYRTERTISQRDTDCFVFGFDATNRLVEVTRVSLVANIDMTLPRHRRGVAPTVEDTAPQNVSTLAVGRVFIGPRCDVGALPSTSLRHGACGSAWVA